MMSIREIHTPVHPQITETENTTAIGDHGDTCLILLGPVFQYVLDVSLVLNADILEDRQLSTRPAGGRKWPRH